jgi:hypothetical protein
MAPSVSTARGHCLDQKASCLGLGALYGTGYALGMALSGVEHSQHSLLGSIERDTLPSAGRHTRERDWLRYTRQFL